MAQNQDGSTTRHTAGLFDIRFIIGALLAIYGVVLLLTGLLGSDANVEDAGPINVWSGLGLLVVGAFFAVWTKLRPTVVPAETEQAGPDDEARPAH